MFAQALICMSETENRGAFMLIARQFILWDVLPLRKGAFRASYIIHVSNFYLVKSFHIVYFIFFCFTKKSLRQLFGFKTLQAAKLWHIFGKTPILMRTSNFIITDMNIKKNQLFIYDFSPFFHFNYKKCALVDSSKLDPCQTVIRIFFSIYVIAKKLQFFRS